MGFQLRDHTADVAVEATGSDLATTFAAVADGLTAAACDDIPEPDDDTPLFEVSVAAEGREALLFDYLDQLIYERDVRSVLPVDNRVRIVSPDEDDETDEIQEADEADETDEATDTDQAAETDEDTADPEGGDDTDSRWQLEATYRGLSLDDVDAREIKAVTYSEMRIEERDEGWRAYVVFDV